MISTIDQTCGEKKTICIIANGCHENHYDAALLEKSLGDDERFRFVKGYKEADIIILLGCANTQHMENETRALIEHVKQTKKDKSEVMVLGCISRISPDFELNVGENIDNYGIMESQFREIENASSVSSLYKVEDEDICQFKDDRKAKIFGSRSGNGDADKLNKISFPIKRMLFDGVKYWKDFFESKINIVNSKTYCIKIATGCSGNCSYCVIKTSRGKVRSKPLDRILEEFQKGLDLGYQQFALIGTDLGDYGGDQGNDLIDLLEKMTSLPGRFFIKLRNVNPRWIIAQSENFYDLLGRGNIRYILSPIQSGSNRILELMNRGYKQEDFANVVKKIRSSYPSVLIQSQVIVGFPTESEEDFMETRHLVNQNLFHYMDVFRYSDRNGTKSQTIYPKVPEPVIMHRYRKLLFKSLLNHPIQKLQIIYGLNYV
jgi:threonylcarbamoyladenosine tRNA methylthiotransferase CDKAL1